MCYVLDMSKIYRYYSWKNYVRKYLLKLKYKHNFQDITIVLNYFLAEKQKLINCVDIVYWLPSGFNTMIDKVYYKVKLKHIVHNFTYFMPLAIPTIINYGKYSSIGNIDKKSKMAEKCETLYLFLFVR